MPHEDFDMPERLTFNLDTLGLMASTAAEIVFKIESGLPRVPWLSNSGQQEAFRKIVSTISDAVEKLDADEDAKYAIIFWALTVLYANKTSFRLAVASVKNWGGVAVSPAVSLFLHWIGSNSHPNEVLIPIIEARRLGNAYHKS